MKGMAGAALSETATDQRVTRIVLHRQRAPLRVPYKLSFGPVEAFDTILVEIAGEGGRAGFGEATFLPGYSEETMEGSWGRATALAEQSAGRTTGEIVALAAKLHQEGPFTATAFTTACEMLSGHSALAPRQTVDVPLLAIVNADEPAGYEAEIEGHLAAGYRTLKVKVGFDLEPDLARVERIRRFVAGRAAIRVDGNQGYARDEALRFAATLEPEGIELLEQPADGGDWETAADLAKVAQVPMMLDESIFGIADVERAAELGAARYIKFKLMKAGGIDRLAGALKRIRDLGMVPVLGNGVAGEVGCWMEGCVAAQLIDNAGEMNGFLKPAAGIFAQPIKVENGAMILEAGAMPAIDRAALEAVTIEHREFASQ
jgi:L-alanine-DL-glutamate epimerase-like enolase superfamily enzyme